MSLLSSTLGWFIHKFKTVDEWLDVYSVSLLERQITAKTLGNRQAHVRRLSAEFGRRSIGSIKPHEIGALIAKVGKTHPVAAKRTLIEARAMFDEAIANGWLTNNPAKAVRTPKISVKRRRLSLDEWKLIYEYAKANRPPWVHRMILLALVTGQRRSDLVKMKFSDVWAHDDGVEYLHITQAKTGARLAIPLDLRLDSIEVSVREAIELCRGYAKDGDGFLLRKTTGKPPCPESMSWRFEEAREAVIQPETGGDRPPTLHECRSLSAREYVKKGVKTQDLLGHAKQSMTDLYHDDRGLGAREGTWKVVKLPPTTNMATAI